MPYFLSQGTTSPGHTCTSCAVLWELFFSGLQTSFYHNAHEHANSYVLKSSFQEKVDVARDSHRQLVTSCKSGLRLRLWIRASSNRCLLVVIQFAHSHCAQPFHCQTYPPAPNLAIAAELLLYYRAPQAFVRRGVCFIG